MNPFALDLKLYHQTEAGIRPRIGITDLVVIAVTIFIPEDLHGIHRRRSNILRYGADRSGQAGIVNCLNPFSIFS